MKMPLVSIVVPTYNVENYVEECIDSLLNQTYSNLEIIVLDDRSSDNTVKILEQYTDDIHLIKNSTNKGQGTRRNEGMRIAKGDYLYFVDSDDWIEPLTIEETVAQALRTEADLVRFNGVIFYDGEKELVKEGNYNFSHVLEDGAVYEGKELLKKNRKSFSASPCLYLIKNDVIKANQLYFLEDVIHEDEYFTTRLFYSVKRITYVDEAFYHRRYRAASTMTEKDEKHEKKSFESYLAIFSALEKEYMKVSLSADKKKFIKRQLLSIYNGLISSPAAPLYENELNSLQLISDKDKLFLKLSKLKQKMM